MPLLATAAPAAASSATLSTFAWGYDGSGQLGDGGSVPEETPEAIALPGGVTPTAVSAGNQFSLAVGSDGNVYAWGDNTYGELGDGTTTPRSTPEQITLPGGVSATAVSAGDLFSLALGSDGNVYAWGYNGDGQLGDGTTTSRTTPEKITLPDGVSATAVSAGGSFSLAVGSDGNVYAWGYNGGGQLGDGTTVSHLTPEKITLPAGVSATSVSAGNNFSLAVGSDGNVYTWGDNADGQLGDGTSGNQQETPEAITLASGVTAAAVSAGNSFSLAVGSDGNVYAWGYNGTGQLGDGTTTSRSTPEAITLASGVSAISVSAGNYFSLAVGSDGGVYAWGNNEYGELGDGTTASRSTPEAITLPAYAIATAVSAGSFFSLALGSSAPVAPSFITASPPLVATQGVSLDYTFVATGFPQPTYSLGPGAPSWLSIDQITGVLSGTVPAGTTTFSYSVIATNSIGFVVAGPFTVTVNAAPVTVSGTVVDNTDNPIAAVLVDACLTTGGLCDSATTTSTGAFTVSAAAGTTIVLTAYPNTGAGSLFASSTSTLPIEVPAGGVQGETIVLDDVGSLPAGLLLNGGNTLVWSSPFTASLTGCPNGLATLTITGQNVETHLLNSNVVALSETPPGSGFYTGVVPPQVPIHGPVDIESSVSCPPQSVLAPDLGPSTGGTTVIVTGSGFTGATGVSFGDTPAASYTVLSDQAIQVISPPGAGTVPVTVYTASGGSVEVDQYTYVGIDSVAPASGPSAGGTWVIITGTGLSSATSVDFGTTAAEFSALSSTEIEALSPPGTGTEDITVDTLYGGTTPTTPDDEFTYDSDPASSGASATLADDVSLSRSPRVSAGHALSADPPSGLALQILQYIYQQGPSLLSDFGNVKKEIDFALAGLSPSCENSQQAIADLIKLAVAPYVKAAVAAVLPEIEAAIAAAFFEGGPLTLLAVYAITPVAVNYLASQLVSALINAALTAALGPCNKQTPSPPQPPQPGDGPCSMNCNFSPDNLIDPSGNVLDTNGNPISGATVTILRSDDATGPFAPVDVTQPGIEPAINPETTGSDGMFEWEVDSGYYEVQATAPGCSVPGDPSESTATIGPYPVPPPQVGLTITLACADEAPPPTPLVQSVSESTGPTTGGTTLTVLGSGFTPSSAVTFGGTPAESVSYVSPEALTVVSPPGSGLVDVVVETAGGSSSTSAVDEFFYGAPPTVTGLSVDEGPVTGGGSPITVTGSGFTGASLVSFGGLPVSSFMVESDSQIQVAPPPETAGTVDVEVTNAAGTSADSTADQYTYLASPQTVSFTAPASGSVGGSATLSATGGGSDNPVMFSVDPSSGSGVCNVSGLDGATVSFTAVGSCVIDASQEGNAFYLAAPTVSQTITVIPGSQAISFTSTAPSPAIVRGPTYVVSATGGGSGNPVIFSSATTSVCKVSGSTVRFVRVGTCSVDANQAGNANYLAAPTETQSFAVVNGPDAITSANHATAVVGNKFSFTVVTTGAPVPAISFKGKLPKGLTFKDLHDGYATISGKPSSGTGGLYPGSIEASFGTGTTKKVVTEAFVLTVDEAPTITTGASETAKVGTSFSFIVKTEGYPTASLTETGTLPEHVSFTDNGNGTATLSGIPAKGSAGTYPITITASNGVGTPANQSFSLVVKS